MNAKGENHTVKTCNANAIIHPTSSHAS
jgi:hypothetical protein